MMRMCVARILYVIGVCVCALQCIFVESSKPARSRIGGKCAANVDVKLINDDAELIVCVTM